MSDRFDHWILKDGKPVPATHAQWALWWPTALEERRVAYTDFPDFPGRIFVLTVFLGGDHRRDTGQPLLYETRAFGGLLDGEMARYSTRAQAEQGHAEMVRRVNGSAGG
jgi:hypothetical protein